MKRHSLYQYIEPGWTALRYYWKAICLIQLAALIIVMSYYSSASFAQAMEAIGTWKTQGGLLFAAVSTVFSGGIIPELIKRCIGRPLRSYRELMHQFVMWALLGIIVDLFYRLQVILFGSSTDIQTLFYKVIFDQFVFTPLLSIPFITLWFMLYEVDYDLKKQVELTTVKRIVQRGLPLWATSLSFWPVMLFIVYSLPSALQFPLFLLANAAFSLLMIFIARSQAKSLAS